VLQPSLDHKSRIKIVIVFLRSVLRLLDTANVVPSSPIVVTLMMEAISTSEITVLTRVTRRNIPEDVILPRYRRENLKYYKLIYIYIQVSRKLRLTTVGDPPS
jgi:hypothetical protein